MNINEQMLSKFKHFINDLIKVFPEHEECINKNYTDILSLNELIIEDNEIVADFLKNISDISDNIMNKDSSVFTDKLYLIKEISMKQLWDSDISNKTRSNIWKYLNIFCLINLNLTSGDVMKNGQQKLLSGEKVTKKELSVMKRFKKINENINIEENDVEENPIDGLENTSLGNLAKEITKDLNIDENNAQDMLNPNNMMNIFQSINSTLQQKVENNELDMNSLFEEASGFMNNGMMNNMMGMMGGGGDTEGSMPDLSGMMNMMSQMMQQPTGNPQQSSSNPQQSSSNSRQPSINPTQKRLREKLDKKNNTN